MNPKIIFERKATPHDQDLYDSEISTEAIEGFTIQESHLELYKKTGFLVIRGAYTPKEVEEAKRELYDMTLMDNPECDVVYYEGSIRDHIENVENFNDNNATGSTVSSLALGQEVEKIPVLPAQIRARFVRKFMGFTNQHQPLKEMAFKQDLLDLVEKLIGETPVLFQEMAMIKPPGGREKPWHQDHAYFNLPLNTKVAGVWIALGDVNPSNGCMHVIKGGHLEGPHAHFMLRDWQICDTDILGRKSTALLMKAGDLLIFDAKLPHGTPVNNTEEFRWALQFHYLGRSVVESTDEERLEAFGNEGKNVTC